MMMPAWPAAPFVVVQSQFLFELLVVLLHSPAEFSQPHQAPQRDLLKQVREPILGGRFRFRWPLDQQPDRWQLGPVSNMTMSRLHPAGSKAAPLRTLTALPPSERAPRLGGQGSRQVTQSPRLTAIVRPPGPTSTRPRPGLNALRRFLPNRRVRLHPHHVVQLAIDQPLPELRVIAITGVGQHGLAAQTPGEQVIDQLQSQGDLGSEGRALGNPGFAATFRILGPGPGKVQRPVQRHTLGFCFRCTATATWQLPTFPSVPEYCRATPTEPLPCL